VLEADDIADSSQKNELFVDAIRTVCGMDSSEHDGLAAAGALTVDLL
jgi:hypothetical protein